MFNPKSYDLFSIYLISCTHFISVSKSSWLWAWSYQRRLRTSLGDSGMESCLRFCYILNRVQPSQYFVHLLNFLWIPITIFEFQLPLYFFEFWVLCPYRYDMFILCSNKSRSGVSQKEQKLESTYVRLTTPTNEMMPERRKE